MSLQNNSITKKVQELIRKTHNGNESPGCTDGIGTKGFYHWKARSFRAAALDSLAMVLNDACVKRFKVKYLQNYLMIPKEDESAILEVISVLSDECLKRDIKIIGGETAVHKNYPGIEIGISVQGNYIIRKKNKFHEGDALFGIASSGLHSNGFTYLKELFGEEFRQEFVEPTFIYYDTLTDLLEGGFNINGMVHITGGAFTKLKEPLGNNLDAVISHVDGFQPHDIFYEVYQRSRDDERMYKEFNCGIGVVLSLDKEEDMVSQMIESRGFKTHNLGKIVKGTGIVRIESYFSDKEVIL